MKTSAQILIWGIAMMFFGVVCSYAQNITGKILDRASEQPVSGAVVSVNDSTGVVVAWAVAGKDGYFTLAQAKLTPPYILNINMLGYAEETISVEEGTNVTIYLDSKAINLDKTTIVAKKVEMVQDTIIYNIQALKDATDKNLNDVIARIPGMEVSSTGKIKYNGVQLKSLYIEGVDLLGSDYGIATQNINPEDISEIEVVERFQPIRALEGLDKGTLAMNVKLKADKRDIWILRLMAEGGYMDDNQDNIPYAGSFFAMRMGRKLQSINTLEADATGRPFMYISQPDNVVYIGKDTDSYPYNQVKYTKFNLDNAPVESNRTYFNNSLSGSTAEKIVLGNNHTLGVGLILASNTYHSNTQTSRTYLLESDSLRNYNLSENNQLLNRNAMARIEYENNSKLFYLKDKFTFRINGTAGSRQAIGALYNSQSLNNNDFSFINIINAVFRLNDKRSVNVEMKTQYGTNREMSIYSSKQNLQDSINQVIDDKILYNQLSSDIKFRVGSFTLTSDTKVTTLWKWLNIAGGMEQGSRQGNALMRYAIEENIRGRYSSGPLEMNISGNIGLGGQRLQLSGSTLNKMIPLLDANLWVKYKFSSCWSSNLSVSGNSGAMPPEWQFFVGQIVTGPQDVTMGKTDFRLLPSASAKLSLSYQNPIDGWYCTLSGTGAISATNPTISYTGDDYVIDKLSEKISNITSYGANLLFSKALFRSGGKISVEVGYGGTRSFAYQNDLVIKYIANRPSASLEFISSPTRWLRLDLKGRFSASGYKVDGIRSERLQYLYSHNLKAIFYASEKLYGSVAHWYQYNRSTGGSIQTASFIDLGAEWKAVRRLTISITITNLLNVKEYRYTVVSPVLTTDYMFKIRPFSALLGVKVDI